MTFFNFWALLLIESINSTKKIELNTTGQLFPTQQELALRSYMFAKTEFDNRSGLDYFFGKFPVFPFNLKSILFLHTIDIEEIMDSYGLLEELISCFDRNIQKYIELEDSSNEESLKSRSLYLDIERPFNSSKLAVTLISTREECCLNLKNDYPMYELNDQLFKKNLIQENGGRLENMDDDTKDNIIKHTSEFLNTIVKKESCCFYKQNFKDSRIYLETTAEIPKQKIKDISELTVTFKVSVCSKFSDEIKKRLEDDIRKFLRELDDSIFDQYIAKEKMEILMKNLANAGFRFNFKKEGRLSRELLKDGNIRYNLKYINIYGVKPHLVDFYMVEDINLIKQRYLYEKRFLWNTGWVADGDSFLKVTLSAFVNHFGLSNEGLTNAIKDEFKGEQEEIKRKYIFEINTTPETPKKYTSKFNRDREKSLFWKFFLFYNFIWEEELYEKYKSFAAEKKQDCSETAFKKVFENTFKESKSEYVLLRRKGDHEYIDLLDHQLDWIQRYFEGKCVEEWVGNQNRRTHPHTQEFTGSENIAEENRLSVEKLGGRSENTLASTGSENMAGENRLSLKMKIFIGVLVIVCVVSGIYIGLIIKKKNKENMDSPIRVSIL